MSCPGLCLLNHMCQGSPWGAVLSLSILLSPTLVSGHCGLELMPFSPYPHSGPVTVGALALGLCRLAVSLPIPL